MILKRFQIFSRRGLAASLHLSLFLFLAAPPLGGPLRFAPVPALILLGVFILMEASLRLGGSPRRVRSFLADKLSGSLTLSLLLIFYILYDAMNLTYSPLRTSMAERYFMILGGLLLALGILFYVDCIDRLDNLLMNVLFSGLTLVAPVLADIPLEQAGQVSRILFAGLMCGGVFLLSAQYHRRFKAVVVTALCTVMLPSIYRATGWAQPVALVESVSWAQRQEQMTSIVDQLQGFGWAETLLGRGSGYDIALGGVGAQNFLISDLLCGGVLRFALALSLWLCIGYCIGMLFLYQKGFPFLYLIIFGMIVLDAFTGSQHGFLDDPLFIIFSALLITERTLLKKGKQRAGQGEIS